VRRIEFGKVQNYCELQNESALKKESMRGLPARRPSLYILEQVVLSDQIVEFFSTNQLFNFF